MISLARESSKNIDKVKEKFTSFFRK